MVSSRKQDTQTPFPASASWVAKKEVYNDNTVLRLSPMGGEEAMDKLVVVLDGITVQHAGELLFGSAFSASRRWLGRDTYIRCLEDFAFAIVFGSEFSTSGSLPKVREDRPGFLVTTEFKDRYIEVDADKSLPVETMLMDYEFRESVSGALSYLEMAFRRQWRFWRDFVIREAIAHLGDHELLFQPSTQPDSFVFAKSPPYLVDRKLQEQISTNYTAELSNQLRKHLPVQRVAETALREFIARATLTHCVIDKWYEVTSADALESHGMRLPHITRSILGSVRLDTQSEPLQPARTIITQHALAHALSVSATRENLIQYLKQMPYQKPFPMIRALFMELSQEMERGQDKERKRKKTARIIDEINKLRSGSGGAQDPIKIEFSAPVGIGEVKLATPALPMAQLFSRVRRAFRQSSRFTGTWDQEMYASQLDRVFPELRIRDS